VLLVTHCLLLANSQVRYSATLNEPAHLLAGISYLDKGSFTIYRVNPPLIRFVAAAPAMISGYAEDWSVYYAWAGARPEFSLGEVFVRENGVSFHSLLVLGRLACVPFMLLGGLICFLWARDLFGRAAGYTASVLCCFSPMILGNGSLIVPDAHAMGLGLLACYTFWRWLKNPTWTQTILTGVVLGLAELSKTTFIVFYPIWPVIWVVYRIGQQRASIREHKATGSREQVFGSEESSESGSVGDGEPGRAGERESAGSRSAGPRRVSSLGRASRPSQREREMTAQRWVREAGMLAVRMLIGIYVLNVGYLGEGSFTRLGQFQFVSKLFGGDDAQLGVGANRFVGTPLAVVPVPFPSSYVIGIDLQQRDFESWRHPSYLRGGFQEQGWWYYYIYAVLVKTPLGTLGLMLLSVVVCFTRFAPPIRWYDAMVLLVPPAVIFAVASYKCGFSHHSRYIMPCVPFVFVWLGQFGIWMEVAWRRCSEERGVRSEETESVGVGENGSGGAVCNFQFSIFKLRWFRGFSRWLPSPRFGERGRGRGAVQGETPNGSSDEIAAARPLNPSPSPPQSRGRREPARGMAGGLATSTTRTPPTRGGVALGVVSALLLCWTIGSSLYVYPHSLSYFNELAGGPKNGPAHLLNSNIDWGQDLLFLEKWAIENAQGVPVYTAFYNLYNPFDLEIAGIEPWPFRREDEVWDAADTASVTIATDSDAGSIGHVGARRSGDRSTYVADGFYAISVNLLYDYPWAVYDLEGRRYQIDRRPHGYLRSIEPVGWAGYSIRIFSAQQLRAAFAAQPTPPLWDG